MALSDAFERQLHSRFVGHYKRYRQVLVLVLVLLLLLQNCVGCLYRRRRCCW
jgi:hypothetical protein